MKCGFLLRFQEVPTAATDVRTAKTRTFVDREKPDEGWVVPLAGTNTVTEIKGERPDSDRSESFYVFPH